MQAILAVVRSSAGPQEYESAARIVKGVRREKAIFYFAQQPRFRQQHAQTLGKVSFNPSLRGWAAENAARFLFSF